MRNPFKILYKKLIHRYQPKHTNQEWTMSPEEVRWLRREMIIKNGMYGTSDYLGDPLSDAEKEQIQSIYDKAQDQTMFKTELLEKYPETYEKLFNDEGVFKND